MIPDKSKGSIKEGNWLICKDGINVVQIWSSNLNGKEKVFLNNELVSEKRNLKMHNSHIFKDKYQKTYEVIFKVENLLKGTGECIIKKENIVLKNFKIKYLKGKNFTLKRILILILTSTFFGFAMANYKLPNFTLYIFILIISIIHLLTRDNGDVLIK